MGRRVILKLRPGKVENGRPFRPFLTLNAGIYRTTGEAQSKHGIPFSKHRPFVCSPSEISVAVSWDRQSWRLGPPSGSGCIFISDCYRMKKCI
ncbi:hypothetical protein BDFB_006929 [Asbolus verrucosus]|uniref:Uncharacterized protein n=1 Tax=Asbolus verrucosus TaxID=1661398 RepID=A0A482VD78_ASBVE|nr:hypothetical protein BDFB_006929 [Asbolus verrucosus]